MRYLGLLKNTFIDYPGRIACAVFLPGCNYCCPWCHNHELMAYPVSETRAREAGLFTMEDYRAFLAKRNHVLEAVVISGGEPFLSPDLGEVAAIALEFGLLVKIDTNGSYPEKIAASDADYYALDVKTLPEKYFLLAPGFPQAGTKMLESMEVLRSSGKPHEFRITCAHETVSPSDFRGLSNLFKPCDLVFLQNARTVNAMRSTTPYSDAELRLAAEILASSGADVRLR